MIDWRQDEVLKVTNAVIADVSEDVSDDVERDAKRILKQKAKKTSDGGLLDQFSIVKSKFKDGGFMVQVQGRKKWRKPYHASFLEMGTFKDEPKPFLRPALKKNNIPAQKEFAERLEKTYKRTK